ncbi:hypothetical protein VF14_11605 [Nostoc linckia z18]|uniref:Uncharacterized protein n=2 Tax=Nostoc linckia TaxID=92942 RepID=A0A9Q5ZA31_NOSLI|nr:hypothetical protein [Nostoc linckia]PHK40899.1 hypothetical protein VF12_08645 [Nostoc linckia z15]PHK46442.1 hypothetical protein VF13_10880 [Nostoc linckia z16]PHJ60242.1 hypothetical protein VF02_23035 [Nostoc linckia z1]PHJ63808.1 hypothetical protein VF05_24000 [Nostoc linckia z3]PHJ70822.1 hypothetical protein VF03_21570 [Nostoc linckia z2]
MTSFFGRKKKIKFNPSKTALKIAWWGVIGLGLWICYLNIGPYAYVVKILSSKVIDTTLIQGFYAIPLLGKFLQAIGLISHWGIGLLIWAVIQVCQILPILLKHNRKYIKNILDEVISDEVYQVRETDDPLVAQLKRLHNLLPLQSIRKARTYAKVAYGVDAVFCTIAYPPIPGGDIGQLLFVLVTGQLHLIDWGAVALMVITMFCVEILLNIGLWWAETTRYLK